MELLKCIYLILFYLKFGASQRLSSSHGGSPTCEPIKIDLCRDIGYNLTGMPNLAGNSLQADAKIELETYMPLVTFQCANELQFFLCSVYVPICTDGVTKTLIGPCCPMCERVKKGCLPLLEEVKLPWPEKLTCSKFPKKNDMNHICIEGPGKDATPSLLPTFNDTETNPMLTKKMKEQLSNRVSKKLAEKYDKQKKYIEMIKKQIKKANKLLKNQEPAQVR